MKNRNETIRKMVVWLNNEEKDGGFWPPNIQRSFVWHEEQIERLFDSIMREYPISTLLVWRTQSLIRRRKFVDNYRDGLKVTDAYVPEQSGTKLLVLDGQQRLQSLFIGLKGSYNKAELHMNILSGDRVAPEDIRYKFRFLPSTDAVFPWIRLKDIVLSNKKPRDLRESILKMSAGSLGDDDQTRIEDNLDQVREVFVNREVLTYQELDSVDQPDLYTEDDVVEIFIRANSGGTKLGKSDLLFALLTASWEEADERMEYLLEVLNEGGYGFTRDFILKTCLALLGKGARYDVKKFRDGSTREEIIERWKRISAAISDVRDFLYGKTFIRNDRALPSYLGLIPLIYTAYHYPEGWKAATNVDQYLLRTLITGAFSGTPDNLIDRCTKRIDESLRFSIKEMFELIRADNRTLEISRDALFEIGYGSREIHLIFNLWYRGFTYHPAFRGGLPQIDHIFPQSLLRTVKRANPDTGKLNMLKYYADERNQLANCMLLTADENGAGGKWDTPPETWFADKSDEYLDLHLIPKDRALWTLENFEAFIEARKQLIAEKFASVLFGATNT